MTTIGEALKAYKQSHPEATVPELIAFTQGWTAHEVAINASKNN